MKPNFWYILVLFCFVFSNAKAASPAVRQDTIILKKGTIIVCKIKEITDETVWYSLGENNRLLYKLFRAEIQSMKLSAVITPKQNTAKSIENPDYVPPITPNTLPAATYSRTTVPSRMYLRGEGDADIYYKGYRGAGTATLLSTIFLGGLGGLLVAFLCSSPPREHNLGYIDAKLMHDPDYRNGYTRRAHRKKKNKVWTNLGVGLFLLLAILIAF